MAEQSSPLVGAFNNPALPGIHADPFIAHFAGKYWMYPTAEIDPATGGTGGKFRAFSSVDMARWTDEGVIFDMGPQVSWADVNGWAPTVAFRNNRYYFYFSAGGIGGGQNSFIGVAVGDSPRGPFTEPLGRAMAASKLSEPRVEAIDPHVFIDAHGQAYMYYGGSWASNLAVQRLNPDMTSFTGPLYVITPPHFTEAPFMVRRNGQYYLSYSSGAWFNDTYNVRYATAPSPIGPWTYRGQILVSDGGHKGPGHHALVQAPGTDTWVIAYHYWDPLYAARHTATDFLRFNGDGTIAPVAMTGGGVVRRWESLNMRGHFIRHAHGRGRTDANVAPAADGEFFMVSGLATADPAAVSFQSINFPNSYLRHRNGELWLDHYDGSGLFNADATFFRRPGLASGADVSFESYNFPGRYIRHRNFLLCSEPAVSTLDRNDATFIVR